MVQLVLGWLLKRWIYVLVVGGVLAFGAWSAKQGYDLSKRWIESRIEATVVEMLKQREKIDDEIEKLPDSAVRDRLHDWVLPGPDSPDSKD